MTKSNSVGVAMVLDFMMGGGDGGGGGGGGGVVRRIYNLLIWHL